MMFNEAGLWCMKLPCPAQQSCTCMRAKHRLNLLIHPTCSIRRPSALLPAAPAAAEEQAEAANYARLEAEEARREAAAQLQQMRSELWAAEARANLVSYGTPEGGLALLHGHGAASQGLRSRALCCDESSIGLF